MLKIAIASIGYASFLDAILLVQHNEVSEFDIDAHKDVKDVREKVYTPDLLGKDA
ncbi:MAG: hypothetical protein LBS39_00195 [Campylobacteraceae bacterium]|jgi:hypothetical protein|nr:hypothetical protein [Campylobacteraceae bacterium]